MGLFPFSKREENDEKKGDPPPSPQEDGVTGYGSGEGEVDEPTDDLHRGMKPRQLSEYPLSASCAGYPVCSAND